MKTLVVFDLDGTLIDSRQDLAESANAMLAAYGAGPLPIEEIASMVGDGARQLVTRALDGAHLQADVSEALLRFLDIYGRRLLRHTAPYVGVTDMLVELAARHRLALLTNKPEGLSRRILAAFEWSHLLPHVVGGDSGFPRKPDPAGLQSVMSVAGSLPGQTVYVGDSMIDVETARAAGCAVIVAAYGFGHLRAPVTLQPQELSASSAAEVSSLVDRALAR
jgi:phosphoglycolate phosphatase